MKTWYADILRAGDSELRQGIAQVLVEERRRTRSDRHEDVGRVVEFLRGGRHLCGVIRPSPPGRGGYVVLDHTGREHTLRRSKIVALGTEKIEGKQRHSLIEQLIAIHRRREHAKETVDLATLWELAIEAESPEFELQDLVELYFGTDEGQDDRAVLARALDDGSWFARQGRSYRPRSRQSVAWGRERGRRLAERQAELNALATWVRAVADGKKTTAPQNAATAIGLLEEFVLGGPESGRRHDITELMRASHLHGMWAAFEVLVKLGHWKPDVNLDLLRNQVPVAFPAAVVAESEAALKQPIEQAGRWWFGKVYAIAPEGGPWDRAFSMRRSLFGYRVGIHLAVPEALVPAGGLVAAEIMGRGAALSLPDQRIPLLPPAISRGSEWSDRERRTALSIELVLNKQFEMKRSRVRLRTMRADNLLDFAAASSRAAQDPALRSLLDLARHLNGVRRAAGSVDSSPADFELGVAAGNVTQRDLTAEEPARTISRELSILANAVAGRFCVEKGIPAVYEVAAAQRVEPEPGLPAPVRDYQRQRDRVKTVFQTRPQANEALGIELSTPVANPFGSALDFAVQGQLLHWLRTGAAVCTEEDLKRVLETTAWARELKEDIEPAAQRYWLLKPLEASGRGTVDGLILERLAAGNLVGLYGGLLRAFVPTARGERTVDVGDRVLVRIGRVSARRNELEVSGISKLKEQSSPASN